MKSAGPVILSIILGTILGSIIMSVTLPPHTGSGVLPSPNFDDNLMIAIKGAFGGIFGLVSSLAALALEKNSMLRNVTFRQVVIFTVVFGLINSLIFAALELNNAVYGQRPPVHLNEFQKAAILRTAIVEFITGCAIACTSFLLIRYWNRSTE